MNAESCHSPSSICRRPFQCVKLALVLGFTLGMALNSSAADAGTVAERAQKASVGLAQGCIVIAGESAGTGPVYAVSGQQEPAGVPPEKVIFEIGSISKVFTGLLLAQSVIEKKVTLDTTLREVMGPAQSFADEHVAAITLLQLATHTSGLPRLPEDLIPRADPADPYASYDRKDLNATIARTKLAHAPPFPVSYSNLGIGLLGDLLARLHGKGWAELAVDRIAKPLDMVDTCVTLTPEQEKRLAPPYAGNQPAKRWRHLALAGSGALHSTASDLVLFARALGQPASTPLETAIRMTEQPRAGTNFGLGLPFTVRNGQTEYWYQGGTGGYRSWISVKAGTREIVVMLINNSGLSPQDVLFGKPPAPPPAPTDAALADYVGVYDTGVKAGATAIHYTFEARGSDLWMQVTGQSFVPLSPHPTAKDRFEFTAVKAEIQFTRKKGEIVSATLFQDGLEILAKKMPPSKVRKR